MSEHKETGGAGRKPSLVEQRRKARSLLVQALYQWQLASTPINQLEAQFRIDNDMSRVDVDYFSQGLRGVIAQVGELDALLAPVVDRELRFIDPVELAIIRLGAFELKERQDVPYRVVINEGVELVKKFGGTEGHRFVNSVLDRLAPGLRGVEVAAAGRRGGGPIGSR